jgi:Collagen triple helix repeat (20 copies)
MLRLIGPKLSFANVVSMIALFVALGGSSYAAVKLKKDSVGATQIRSSAVGGVELAPNSVTSPKVLNGSLQAADFAPNQLPRGAQGGQGPQGPAGPQGPEGPQGTPGVNGTNGADGEDGADGTNGRDGATGPPGTLGTVTTQFTQASTDLADGTEMSLDVFCPPGQRAIGGGFRGDDTRSEQTLVGSSRPVTSASNTSPPVDDGTFTGWRVSVINPTGGATTGIKPEVWVICASP